MGTPALHQASHRRTHQTTDDVLAVVTFIWHKYPATLPMVPGMMVWGAVCEPFQFVVSFDRLHQEWGASVKFVGDRGKLIALGTSFESEWEAKQACVQHWQQWNEAQTPAQR